MGGGVSQYTVCLGFHIYPYLMFRGFEPGAFKMVKYQCKKIVKVSSRFEAVSFRVDVQDATTEL